MTATAPVTSKGRATRERIVAAAVQLVHERGVAAVSLDDVQDHAGVSRSQMYHYFENKAALVHVVIGSATDSVLDAQSALLDGATTWAGIDRWFAALVAMQLPRNGSGGCPIGSLAGQLAEGDGEARAAIAAGLDRWTSRLVAGLQRMKADGKLRRSADPAELATATMALVQGGLLLTQVHRDPQQLRIALDAARVVLHDAALRHH